MTHSNPRKVKPDGPIGFYGPNRFLILSAERFVDPRRGAGRGVRIPVKDAEPDEDADEEIQTSLVRDPLTVTGVKGAVRQVTRGSVVVDRAAPAIRRIPRLLVFTFGSPSLREVTTQV